MELTTRGRYAVMAMTDLAKNGEATAVPLSAISARQHLSIDYLEQLFLKLRRAGLVASTRGRMGGYRLGRCASTINVAEILSAVDEQTEMTRCRVENEIGCLGGERCETHGLWVALSDHIQAFLASVSLQDILDKSTRAPLDHSNGAVGAEANLS